jgi:hypothetical protein
MEANEIQGPSYSSFEVNETWQQMQAFVPSTVHCNVCHGYVCHGLPGKFDILPVASEQARLAKVRNHTP